MRNVHAPRERNGAWATPDAQNCRAASCGHPRRAFADAPGIGVRQARHSALEPLAPPRPSPSRAEDRPRGPHQQRPAMFGASDCRRSRTPSRRLSERRVSGRPLLPMRPSVVREAPPAVGDMGGVRRLTPHEIGRDDLSAKWCHGCRRSSVTGRDRKRYAPSSAGRRGPPSHPVRGRGTRRCGSERRRWPPGCPPALPRTRTRTPRRPRPSTDSSSEPCNTAGITTVLWTSNASPAAAASSNRNTPVAITVPAGDASSAETKSETWPARNPSSSNRSRAAATHSTLPHWVSPCVREGAVSRRHEGVHGIGLHRLFDADLLRDRRDQLAEAVDCLL